MVPRRSGTSTWTWVVTAFGGARGGGSHLFTDLLSPSDFKIKNFKKEFKKKRKTKTSVVKRPIFRMQMRYFRALGSGSVLPPPPSSGGCARVQCRDLRSLSCTCGSALRKARVPEGSSTPSHVFCNPTPSTEDVIKKQTKK